MATRYTDKKKAEVVKYVKDYDQKHGRGGQAAAKKKYKINPISIKKWCVDAGVKTGGKTAKKKTTRKAKTTARATTKRTAKKKTTRRAAAKPKAKAKKKAAKKKTATRRAGANGSAKAALTQLNKIQKDIASLQKELKKLS